MFQITVSGYCEHFMETSESIVVDEDPNPKPLDPWGTSYNVLIDHIFGPCRFTGICPICASHPDKDKIMHRKLFICEPIIKFYQQKRDALIECCADMNQLDTMTMWKHMLIELQFILKIEELTPRMLHDHITQHLTPWPKLPGRPTPLPWEHRGPVGLGFYR